MPALRQSIISLTTYALLIATSLAPLAAGEEYKLPATWVGTKDGSPEGNPALVDGAPRWRLDAVVNPGQKADQWQRPDPLEPFHYMPLSWAKDRWKVDLPQYQSVEFKDGGVIIGAYGCGVGEFCKNYALVFLVPRDGNYALTATVDVMKWEGNPSYNVILLQRENRSGMLRFLKLKEQRLEIKKGNDVKIEGLALRKDSELVILPELGGYYCGASATFRNLRLAREDLLGGIQPGKSREPASRAKEPIAKGDPTGINFPLCIVPVDAAKDGEQFRPGLHAAHDCMGVIDVTKPPYNADNTGKTDVSDILTRALRENNNSGWGNRIVYLPDGIYLVEKTVSQKESGGNVGPCLQGQSRKGTIIRLKDGTWPSDDGKKKYVLKTGDGVAQNFNRILRNLTVSIGKNNDGACGLFFYGNNQASMADIDVISEDGKGQVGLDLCGGEQGPCLVRNTLVKGFKIGTRSDALNAVTFHNLTLEGQREVGFQNLRHEQWICGLTSINKVPAVVMDEGALVLINAKFSGGEAGVPAIRHKRGMLFVRNVTATGYGKAIESTDKEAEPVPAGLSIDEYSSGKGVSLFGPPKRSLNLPMKEPAEPAWEQDMGKWASVEWYKRDGLSDAEALQAAIDDKRNTTICIPKDVRVTGAETVQLRGGITRLIGTGGSIIGQGSLVVTDGGPAVVKIERLALPLNTIDRTGRTVVVESVTGSYIRHEGSGELYVSDTCLNIEVNNPKAHLWVWHFNSEAKEGITVKGGTAWVFGWKTEGTEGRRILATGGSLEILGFLDYTGGTDKSPWPLIDISNTEFSIVSLAQFTFGNWDRELYHRLVKETRDGVSKEHPGTWMPLFTSWDNKGAKDIRAPALKP